MMIKTGAITCDYAVIKKKKNLPSVTESMRLPFLIIDRCKDWWCRQRSYVSFINRGRSESTFIYGHL